MKNNIIVLSMLIVFISSCSTPKYLPSADKIDVNTYGSYIKISQKNKPNTEGELIALDHEYITVLNYDSKECLVLPLAEINKFTLLYATPKHYGWTIPASILLSVSHGFVGMITLPLNLIVTISTTASSELAFTYNEKSMTFDKLKMFARFPQGIPQNIKISDIK